MEVFAAFGFKHQVPVIDHFSWCRYSLRPFYNYSKHDFPI